MLTRFASSELDDGFAPACGVARDGCAPAAEAAPAPSPALPRAQQAVAVLAAVLGLAIMAAAVAKPAMASIATAPADETAAWALMLVGLAMVGVAAGRQISAELIGAARRSAPSTSSRG